MKAIKPNPMKAKKMKKIFPPSVFGEKSPYPAQRNVSVTVRLVFGV